MKRWFLPLLLLLSACETLREPDPALAAQVTPAQIIAAQRVPDGTRKLVWGGTVRAVTNLRERTRIEILSYPLDRERRPLRDRRATGLFVLEMDGFIEPAGLKPGLPVTATGHYAGTLLYREREIAHRVPRLRGTGLHVWADAPTVPATHQRPDVRWNIGIGTHGSGVGVRIGL